MECHEVCDLFPAMGRDEFAAISADIAKRGQLDPIWTYQDRIIDGRHRYNACCALGIAPKFQEWNGEGGSLIEFVVSRNLHRRHLTASQCSTLAAETKPMLEEAARARQAAGQRKGGQLAGNGRPINDSFPPNLEESKTTPPEPTPSLDNAVQASEAATKAAEMCGVSRSSVYAAQKLMKAAPDLYKEVKAGRMTLHAAQKELKKRTQPEPAPAPKPKPEPDEDESDLADLPREHKVAVYLSTVDPANLVKWMRCEMRERNMSKEDVVRYIDAITVLLH